MLGKTNTGGSGGTGAILTVTAPVGVTVVASKDGKTYTKTANADGVAVFKGLATGTWVVTISDGIMEASQAVAVKADYTVEISFNAIPDFTYTGEYKIVNDADQEITESPNNWKIRLLTSGTLKFSTLNGVTNGIDIFLVGGGGGGARGKANSQQVGGGGGGGGYATTEKGLLVSTNQEYEIIIGAGGSANGGGGGTSSAFDLSANGGGGGAGQNGGAGGNAGGKGADGSHPSGYDGIYGSLDTNEFGEETGTQYAGGGGGGGAGTNKGGNGSAGGGNGAAYGANNNNGYPASANTGGGGGGGHEYGSSGTNGGAGGSGIVIIRNARG